MSSKEQAPLTDLLNIALAGDLDAQDSAYKTVYSELKKIALRERFRWDGNLTLSATALISEMFIRLSASDNLVLEDRNHFFALCSTIMRRALINYAASKKTKKRGKDILFGTFDENLNESSELFGHLIALRDVFKEIEAKEPRWARILDCRLFGGMSNDEIAEVLSVSVATVKRDWLRVKLHVHSELL